jgi:hypothetical protein
MPGKAGTGEPANGGTLGGRPLNAEVDRDLVKQGSRWIARVGCVRVASAPPLNTRALGGVLEDVHMAVTDSLPYPRGHALFP